MLSIKHTFVAFSICNFFIDKPRAVGTINQNIKKSECIKLIR